MINRENLQNLLIFLEFEQKGNIWTKYFQGGDSSLKVDFQQGELIYPEDKGLVINERQTCNFKANENFVVFECVHRLLEKGYKPEHIELEPKWKSGHGASGGRADILVKNQEGKPTLIVECKTSGREFDKAWKDTQNHGGQILTYADRERTVKFVCLYTSEWKDENLSYENYMITLSDVQNLIEQYEGKEIKPLFYKDITDVKQWFQVWNETYQRDYQTSGIFDAGIQAYNIGQQKLALSDLKYITGREMKSKFNEFSEILRKYNVSNKEAAFDKLINLFLCKIVDENQAHYNGKDLEFHWRGQYADDYFSLIDRLQKLYKDGMEEYLGEKITFIDNKKILDAFGYYRDRNATRDHVLQLFKQQKYFTNSDFGFIDVHNDKLFYQNAVILLDVVRMWQDFQLNGEQQNQFLGDMFEAFLDKGFKQSKGQFFTPIPICKFILSSLPLEDSLNESKKAPRVIDYACGSGHFLTEYAAQIRPILEDKNTLLENPAHHINIKDYYRNVFGVEKEYRLSKVAKMSAFMYGQDEINIIYCDALRKIEQEISGQIVLVEDETCDFLVANPPFAVEGFLTTLPQEERKNYTLFNKDLDLNQRNIQCFFIERAKQLLAPNGIAAIIVPTSILSNTDAIHIQTREILLKYFDFISIAELGSKTFGKTGTNTVVLFLKRKTQQPEIATQYWDRVLDFFQNWNLELNSDGKKYYDLDLVRKYSQHIGVPYEDYQTLLAGSPSAALLGSEMFDDYKTDFDKLSEITKLKEAKTFKAKTQIEQEVELNKRFLNYLQAIEKQKLYYFMLASDNPQKVLIVKSPTDGKEQKQFLGYDWSEAEGNEGIKYYGGDTVHQIITPMFDPRNVQNQSKINYYIQQNFKGETPNIPDELANYITYANLTDLLDFSRKDFNKAFSLAPKKNKIISDKWELLKLDELVETLNGLWTGKKPPFVNVTVIRNTNFAKGGKLDLSDVAELDVELGQYEKRKLQFGDIIIEKSGGSETQAIGRVVFFDKQEGEYSYSNFTSRIRLSSDKLIAKYLYLYLNYFYEQGYTFDFQNGTSGIKNLNFDAYLSIKIPIPPIEMQQQVIDECEAIDQAVSAAQAAQTKGKKEIEQMIENITGKGKEVKLSEFAFINPSKTEIKNVDENILVSFVEMASVSEKGFIAEKIDKPLKDLKKGSYTYFAENDIIIAKITPCMENGKCALAKDLTNNIGMGSSEFHVIRTKETVLNTYLFALLNREVVRKEAEKNFTGSSGHRRVPASFYENYKIPVLSLIEQEILIAAIEKIEQQITDNQAIINTSANKKQAVMKKYL